MTRRLGLLTWTIVAWLGVSGRVWAQEEAAPPVVKQIEVDFKGPKSVNPAIVRANIQTTVDQPLSRTTLEQDVRDLINTGYFLDVRVLQESVTGGVKVIYQVQCKAKVKEIIFEGQTFYKEPRLRRDLKTKVGDMYDEHKAHEDGAKLVEAYNKAGFPDATVAPQASVDADTGQAIVRFKVQEGPRVFIQDIRFEGLQAFRSEQGMLWFRKGLLTKMKTKRRWWGSWLAGTGVLKEEQFRDDLDTLREFYRANGYLDMKIVEVRRDRVAPKWMVIVIHVYEGQQYHVGEITINGNKLFPVIELTKQLKMKTGATFTPDGLTADTKALEDYYGSRGYLDTVVRPVRTPEMKTSKIDLAYELREGELNYIELVQIRGNTKTKDKVVRRELAVTPGQKYNTVRVDRSAERLRNLGYFSKVETTPHATEVPNRKDLIITVEEQRTGSMTFGAGFSSVDSFIGFVEVTQGNFDLFNAPSFTGGGQKLRARIQLGFERQDFLVSFTEPWFLDQKLSFGVDLFHRSSSYLSNEFEEKRTGGALRLEKALTEYIRAGMSYSVQNIDLDVDKNVSAELESQEGSDIRSAMEMSLTYDTRDSVFLTTKGNRSELSVELVGGPFGGDVSVYKLDAKTTFYFPFFNQQVLQLVGAAGVVDAYGATEGDGGLVVEPTTLEVVRVNDVPIYDRYFLGGPNTLRGFDYRDVSPKDIDNEPVGGNTYVNATAEYTFPIIERIRGAVFADLGNVWKESYEFTSELRADVGLGVRLNLPIGPLRLDYGYPVLTQDGDSKSGKIQFSVGYQF